MGVVDTIITLLFNITLLSASIVLMNKLFRGREINPLSNFFIGAFSVAYAVFSFFGQIGHYWNLKEDIFSIILYSPFVLAGITLLIATIIKLKRKNYETQNSYSDSF